MKLLNLAAVAACALITSGCSTGGGAEYEENAVIHQSNPDDLAALKSKEPIAAPSVLLYVNGLGCPLCATNVDVQLKRVRGVDDAVVDLGAGTVLVTLKDENRPSPHRLNNAVADAGFTLVKLEPR